ncbi:MAG TPA: TAXI family TRAP transporter solute-binding subunit, partial [Candidatus Binatia bacterium]|nr:TAXI family TRAP transporter solute-binding subunit [Candidatus Binatia bacterium]
TVLEQGFRFLPIDGVVLKTIKALGYRPATMTKTRFNGLTEDLPTIDFSGWPMIVHADMPTKVAYALCEAIEKRRDLIPTDNYKALDIAQLCANDEEAPYDAPLHPGARRFYRERGYLK